MSSSFSGEAVSRDDRTKWERDTDSTYHLTGTDVCQPRTHTVTTDIYYLPPSLHQFYQLKEVSNIPAVRWYSVDNIENTHQRT